MYALCNSSPARALLQRSISIACRPRCSSFSPLSCVSHSRHASSTASMTHVHTGKSAIYSRHLLYPHRHMSSPPALETVIFLPNRDISVSDLASRLPSSSTGDVMILASELGIAMADGPDTMLPIDIAEFIVAELKCVPQVDTEPEVAEIQDQDKKGWKPRPPVVTIMGHVDHGKTTLLDYLRKTAVAAGEAGGITQHIGAFQVQLPGTSGVVSFLDTPGHAAFTAMRARGAQSTDVVVLVVAADDGVMAQTVESINLAQQANVPIVVAINKCDLHNADIQRAKTGLIEHGLQLEEFGGETVGVEISALKGTNISELQESILVTAELADLRADYDAPPRGLVLETKVKQGFGPVATVLVTQGTLKSGQNLVCGTAVAKVKKMVDSADRPMKAATPATPVQVAGWKVLPHAGDHFHCVESEKEAHADVERKEKAARAKKEQMTASVAERRTKLRKMVVSLQQETKALDEKYKGRDKSKSLEKAYRHEVFVAKQKSMRQSQAALAENSNFPKHCILLKGDVQGSLDALQSCLGKYMDERVKLSCIHTGIGNVTQSDIAIAQLTQGTIYCLNTTCGKREMKEAEKKGVRVVTHNVIYKLLDTMKNNVSALVTGVETTHVVGEARVQAIFNLTGIEKRHVAGCMMTEGMILKDSVLRVWRKKELLLKKARLSTLRRVRDDVQGVSAGTECGLSVTDEKFTFEQGDRIEAFEIKVTRSPVKWEF